MSMENPDLIDVFLQPGDYFVGDASFRVRTLLGSCVSITLWSSLRRIGAMSHFLLPSRPEGAGPDSRYGDDALGMMLAELAGLGVRPGECEAKIFGGGDMFPGHRRHGIHVGEKNGTAARDMLAARGIAVVSESLFGNGHRQILFEIASGDVWARQVEKR